MTATERIKVDKGNQIARLCAEVLEFPLPRATGLVWKTTA